MASDQTLFQYSLISLFLIGPPTFIACQFITAPYGKHHRKGWGPTIPPAMAWFIMESPTIWLTLLLFPLGQHRTNPLALISISPFLLHYIHRTIIYPLRLMIHYRKTANDPKTTGGYPVSVALMAFSYNLLNSYVQARWISEFADYTGDGCLWWRFAGGLAVFVVGMAMNIGSDLVLVGLKREGGGYKIPRGGWFEFVSCPNYLGEIVEWLGWAIMTWSWAGLGFFLYTCANLVPRARANHMWYLEKFGEDYPKIRKAVFPFVY